MVEYCYQTKKKVISSILAIIVLVCMLVLTTYALIASFVSIDNNLFQTENVNIELNGGKTVFDATDINIEPGHALVQDFTLENKGTADVYVRLYLENLQGPLQEALTFSVYDGDKLLFSGTANELTKQSPCVTQSPLLSGECRILTAVVSMDPSTGNAYQNGGITFDMTADAVQSRNNPDKSFE